MIKDYDVYEPGRKERVGFSLCLLVVLCVASLLFYGSILGMGLLPMVYRPAERAYLKYRASLRKQRLLLQFRDFLYSLSASFATGRVVAILLQVYSVRQQSSGKKSLLKEKFVQSFHRNGWRVTSLQLCRR